MQPLEVFYEKSCSQKFRNSLRKVADLQPYLKDTPTQVFSYEYCEVFKNTYFEEHLLTAASDFLKQLQNTVSSCFCIDS